MHHSQRHQTGLAGVGFTLGLLVLLSLEMGPLWSPFDSLFPLNPSASHSCGGLGQMAAAHNSPIFIKRKPGWTPRNTPPPPQNLGALPWGAGLGIQSQTLPQSQTNKMEKHKNHETGYSVGESTSNSSPPPPSCPLFFHLTGPFLPPSWGHSKGLE